MSKEIAQSSGGIGFLGLLTIVFIVLKLTGYIDWPWLWVVSPLWLPLLVFIVLCGIALVGYLIYRAVR